MVDLLGKPVGCGTHHRAVVVGAVVPMDKSSQSGHGGPGHGREAVDLGSFLELSQHTLADRIRRNFLLLLVSLAANGNKGGAEGGHTGHHQGDGAFHMLPEDLPCQINDTPQSVGGHPSQRTNHHDQREAEKHAQNQFLFQLNLGFAKDKDRDADDCAENE